MQDISIALLVGLILGWIIEWLIDWSYWRPTVAALRQENAQLRHQLDACIEADDSQPSKMSTALAKSRGR